MGRKSIYYIGNEKEAKIITYDAGAVFPDA